MTQEVRPRRLLAQLVRRADYLAKLDALGKANSYDKAEQTALRWAIPQLQALHPEPEPKGRKKP